MMRIGLLGFCFQDENKGCEALTYSFLSILVRLYGNNIEVTNLSTNDLGLVPEAFPEILFKADRLKIKDITLKNIRNLKKFDMVFDITYGDGFSDIYNPKFVFMTTLQKLLVIISRRSLVLLPQTYGPFKRKTLEKLAAYTIKHSRKVYSRDKLSSDYVRSIAKTIPIEATDLAFALPYEKKGSENGKIKIGINVSGLLWNGGFNGNKNQFGLTVNYQEYVKRIIMYFISDSNIEIHIIPHVLELFDTSHDGDIKVSNCLKEEFPSLMLAPVFRTPIEAKSYISDMDVFVGARMHSTIAAISSGVATIPFSYSRKFEGLYGSLGYAYLINGCIVNTDEAVSKTLLYIQKRDELKKQSKASMELVQKKLVSFSDSLTNIMKHNIS